MSLAPRSIVDLGHHVLQRLRVGAEAVIEADGIEAVARIAQVREEPYRPGRPRARCTGDAIAHRIRERRIAGPHEIAAPEFRKIAAAYRPQPASREGRI